MGKKQLNEKELEKATGGYYVESRWLSGKLTTGEAYNHVGENLFFYEDRGNGDVIYAKLNKCWEAEKFFGLYSFTQYDVTIIESSSTNTKYWGPGCNQTLHSLYYDVYTGYSGPRPIK